MTIKNLNKLVFLEEQERRQLGNKSSFKKSSILFLLEQSKGGKCFLQRTQTNKQTKTTTRNKKL